MEEYKVKFISKGISLVEKERTFKTLDEAKVYLCYFVGDSSGNYDRIALLDVKKQLVLAVLDFEDGKYRDIFFDSEMVKLRERFCSKAEKKYLYSISNINEITGRCLITCLRNNGGIPVAETVDLNMVIKAVQGRR